MVDYSQRVFETKRSEFVVPAGPPYGACWVEVMKAIHAARQELVQMGLVEETAEPAADQIRISPGDDEIIVSYTVERDADHPETWRTV